MKVFRFCAYLILLLAVGCNDLGEELDCPDQRKGIDLDHPEVGQKNLYLGFSATDYYIYSSAVMEFTQDSLVMEVIGEDAFGVSIKEYYTSGSPALSDPYAMTDTAYYSLKIEHDSLRFDWTLQSPISPRGRLWDYGVRYPMTPEPYAFDKFVWKVFPSPDMPQFGVTGVVRSYQPIANNFGTCNVRYDVGTVFAHIERPIWIYQPEKGLIVRYTEITSGSYATGFILKLE